MAVKCKLLSVMMHEFCMFVLDMKLISMLVLHCFIMRTLLFHCALRERQHSSAFSLMFLHWACKHLWFQHFLDRWYQLVMWTACLYGMYCLCWLLHNVHNVLYTMGLIMHLLKHPESEVSQSYNNAQTELLELNRKQASCNMFGILSTPPLSGSIFAALSGRVWVNPKNHHHIVNNDFHDIL